MKKQIRIVVYQMIDLEVTGEKAVSISGGQATHSFNKLDEFTALSYGSALSAITFNYGKPYIFDDRLEFQESESVSYSFFLQEIESTDVDNEALKKHFCTLEEH
jgi:hypothetical protein